MKLKAFKIFCALLPLLLIALYAVAADKTASIIVKEAKVYATASSFGKVVGTLKYTNEVKVLEEKGGWLKVSFAGGKQGWIHATSVSSGKTTITSGSADTKSGASSDEVALAGKGFNKQVETQYKKENEKIDFTWVDRMETYRVSTEDMKAFLEKGGLDAAAGGSR